MRKENIPNIITIFRLLLVAPIIWAIVGAKFMLALLLVAIAGASDGIDGFLARKFNWDSELGAILDPLADKLMLIGAYIASSHIGIVPWWLTFAVIARDVIIVVGVVIYHSSFDGVRINPSYVSKINTFFQISLILLVIFNAGFKIFSYDLEETAFYIVFTTTFISGADYLWTWGVKAWKLKYGDDA